MSDQQPTSPDLLTGLGNTLSNLTSALTGGLLPDAQNQHAGILASAVTCLFGHDPFQAESWKGAVKPPNPVGLASPAAGRRDPGTPTSPTTGLHPAAVAVAAATDQIEARTLPTEGRAAAPGISVAQNVPTPTPEQRPADAAPTAPQTDEGKANGEAQAATAPGPKFLFGPSKAASPADTAAATNAITGQAAAAQARYNALSASQTPNDAPAAAAARALGPQEFNTPKPEIWAPRSELDARKPPGAVTGARARVLSFKAASISGQTSYVQGAEKAIGIQDYKDTERLGGHQRQVPIEGMVIHSTYGCTTMQACANASNELRGGTNGYYTGANYYIDNQTGQTYRWAPDNVAMNHIMRGNGAGGNQRRTDLTNANTLSVEIMTKGGEEPSPVAAAAAHRLVSLKGRENGFSPDNVWGHGELTPGHREQSEGRTIASTIRRVGFLPPGSIPPGN